MDRFLGLAYHKWPHGVLHPAVSHRKATKHAMEMVGLANRGFCRGGSDCRCVLFWSAIGYSWPDPKSARDRGFLQRLLQSDSVHHGFSPNGRSGLSGVLRLRRAIGVMRQQIKWFAYAAVVTVSCTILAYIIPGVIETPLWFERVGFALNIAFIPAVPISIGIAILRYRLYEIDLIINRTLVYGSLTATLIALYFGVIVVLQRVFVALTGQQSTLAVVASTLLIAALFNPLRRRIQSFIDRRFYRSKYDAAKTLEAFSAQLRDETDLEALSDDLVGVVKETMQPAHASLWLHPDPALKDKKMKRAAIRESGHEE